MNVVDVNVLVATFMPSHPHHEVARRWWSRALAEGLPMTTPDLVWVGFVRIVTNRRILSVPATTTEAWTFVDAVRHQGSYLEFGALPGVLDEFRHRCLDEGAAGDLATDAYIAAAAATLGAAVVTFDRDFRRFDGLRIVEPA